MVKKLSTTKSSKRVAELKKQGYEVKEIKTPTGTLVLKRKKKK